MNDLGVLRAGDLPPQPPEERWLVRPLWGRASVGIIGGHAKSCKTWLAIDMAISVASSTPALDKLAVADPGPALVFLAEDQLPIVRSRIDAICTHRRIDIHKLDLHVITEPVLRLDTETDQNRLAATVERIKPRLLLLDPLIRLHRLDENRSQEISGLLAFFRELQRRFDCAVILVHHAGKKQHAQPGQSLRGSSDLHAWTDSSLYLVRHSNRIVLTIEHRSARAPDPMTIDLVSDNAGHDIHLAWNQAAPPETEMSAVSIEERVIDSLQSSDEPLTRLAIRSSLRVNNQNLGLALLELERRGRILKTPAGWTAVRQSHNTLFD